MRNSGYVRVFRVSVPGHDATLLHQHDVPYLYISLGPADVINAIQGRPEVHIVMTDGQVGYSLGHFAHIARTDAGRSFDNVTIELLKPQGEPFNLCAQVVPNAATRPCRKLSAGRGFDAAENSAYSIEAQFETAQIEVDLVRLEPETTRNDAAPQTKRLLIALNGSEVQIDRYSKPLKTLHGGEVMWLEAGALEDVSNPWKTVLSYLQLSFKDSGRVTKP